MALELRIEGPGLDVVRRLDPGQPPLVLGRGSECGVCLPDPQRKVSRRHLSVWFESGELHFHVLSIVNGVEMAFGEAPPGARGVLPAGQTLHLAEYRLTTRLLPDALRHADRHALFDREHSGFAPFGDTEASPLMARDGSASPDSSPDEDPFGEWEFEATFRPRGGREAAHDTSTGGTSGANDLTAFFEGLGLDAASLGPLSTGELETIGKLVREMALGLLQLQSTSAGVKQHLRAEDRTRFGRGGDNPLKTDWPEDVKLRYLFGGRSAGAGLTHPERAVRELIAELDAHEVATGTAVRDVIGAVLAEFEPATLRTKLIGDGFQLFANARSWHAYERFFAERSRDLGQWAQRLLDRYFAEAYLRESLRIRRETSRRDRQARG
jgi:predicted component of type VI protein secretion system